MTPSELLDKITSVPIKWRVKPTGGIRSEENFGDNDTILHFCPITYAYFLQTGEKVTVTKTGMIADDLDLNEDDRQLIMDAADLLNCSEENVRNLRCEMITKLIREN